MAYKRPEQIEKILDSGNYTKLIKREYKQAVVLLSGGIDSTVALYLTRSKGIKAIGLEFFYKGRPVIESMRTKRISERANIPLYQMEYPAARACDESSQSKRILLLESNVLYYSLAGAFASKIGANAIVAGPIITDWMGLNDSRAAPGHYNALDILLRQEYGSKSPIIETPFIYLNKTEVVRIGIALNAPLELTWSCPNSNTSPCRKCSQCKERGQAFKMNEYNIAL